MRAPGRARAVPGCNNPGGGTRLPARVRHLHSLSITQTVSNMRALVVDDSKTTRMIIGRIMREIGFEVVEAADGQQALAKLEEIGCADVALVDWNMPEMTGIEFVQAVRAEPAYAEMKVMMVTTESEAEQVTVALEAGANEYAMKPFTKEVIQEKLALLGIG